MLRGTCITLLSLCLASCAAKEGAPPSADANAATGKTASKAPTDPAREHSDMDAKPPAEPEQCQGLLLPDDVSLRHTGQGSHGAASTDITLDLKTGKMTGSDYKLDADGNTPIPLKVDQQASPEQLAAVRELFEKTCAPRRTSEKQEHSAPGGFSMIEIKHADGSSLFVIPGASNLPAGAEAAEVAKGDWLPLFEVWPKTEGK